MVCLLDRVYLEEEIANTGVGAEQAKTKRSKALSSSAETGSVA